MAYLPRDFRYLTACGAPKSQLTNPNMKITALETIQLPDYPSFLFVAVHTDEELTGYADTC